MRAASFQFSNCSYAFEASSAPHSEATVTSLSPSLHMHSWVFFFFFHSFFFLGLHLWHMEIPRLGVESELQLLAQPLNTRPELHLQSWTLNPLAEARDQTRILGDTMPAP